MPKLTVNAIARRAFDAVAKKLDGVIQPVLLVRQAGEKTYSAADDDFVYLDPPTKITGRAVFGTATAAKDQFGDRVQGESDKIAFLEGMAALPNDGEVLTIGGTTYTMAAPASRILEAGTFAAVLLR